MMIGTEAVKEYWKKQAVEAPNQAATLADHNQRLLETQTILKELRADDLAIDVGCGNGYTTEQFAAKVSRLCGVDCVQEMVERAQREHPLGNGEYRAGSILSLPFASASFTAAVTQRCLINLGGWEEQQLALSEIFRVLKPGGRFIMCETTEQGLAKLNSLRVRFGLRPIPVVWHNVLLDEEKLERWQKEHGVMCSAVHRFSTFYLISRVIHPLLVAPEEPKWDAPINEVARVIAEQLPDLVDGASYVSVQVLHKPDA